MDRQLLESIMDYVATRPELTVLDPETAEKLRLRVAEKFGFAENHVWWWESLPAHAFKHPYKSGDEGLQQLMRMLPAEDTPTVLFVTDDDAPPWLGVAGPKRALLDMLGEQRFFEYFIVDSEANWIVFDNHHNTLLGVGVGLSVLPLT